MNNQMSPRKTYCIGRPDRWLPILFATGFATYANAQISTSGLLALGGKSEAVVIRALGRPGNHSVRTIPYKDNTGRHPDRDLKVVKDHWRGLKGSNYIFGWETTSDRKKSGWFVELPGDSTWQKTLQLYTLSAEGVRIKDAGDNDFQLVGLRVNDSTSQAWWNSRTHVFSVHDDANLFNSR